MSPFLFVKVGAGFPRPEKKNLILMVNQDFSFVLTLIFKDGILETLSVKG